MGRMNGHPHSATESLTEGDDDEVVSVTIPLPDAPVAPAPPPVDLINVGPSRYSYVARLIHILERFVVPLQAALDDAGGTHSIGDMFDVLLDQRALLMTSEHAFIIAEVHTFPQCKHLHIWLAGALDGHGDELHGIRERLTQFAKDAHCSRITISGRHGWLRALREHGYVPYHETIARLIQ